ncbi:hypothetical protein C8Q80DRAFT_727334 [Daedaleopsis nitida]|nr:hypothetical protein C8Q80DRAFT_727334 [Daedaleopsis nitida]
MCTPASHSASVRTGAFQLPTFHWASPPSWNRGPSTRCDSTGVEEPRHIGASVIRMTRMPLGLSYIMSPAFHDYYSAFRIIVIILPLEHGRFLFRSALKTIVIFLPLEHGRSLFRPANLQRWIYLPLPRPPPQSQASSTTFQTGRRNPITTVSRVTRLSCSTAQTISRTPSPFPLPTGRWQDIPPKTVFGVSKTPLHPVWPSVGPRIRDTLKEHGIRYSFILPVRFETQHKLGPAVIWIAAHPSSGTTAEDAHRASRSILALLENHGVQGAVVEWIEAGVEQLSRTALLPQCPPLFEVPNDDATRIVRGSLTTRLGMPIATAEREDNFDAAGTVGFFFHENRDQDGDPSTRVLGVSNCHVLRGNTDEMYEFKVHRAPPQDVQIAGRRCGLRDIKNVIANYQVIVDENAENAGDEQDKRARAQLPDAQKDLDIPKTVRTCFQRGDIDNSRIGQVDWAPQVCVDNFQGATYLKDIGTFEVDADRLKTHFKGNVVDLGPYTRSDTFKLVGKLKARNPDGTESVSNFPAGGQLRINGVLRREQLADPDTYDPRNGEPCIVVIKCGTATDLTTGRYVGVEAYVCNKLGVESKELAIFNFDRGNGSFCAKGDSGSLIFDRLGRKVGLLHAAVAHGGDTFVTFATPAWWVIEQLKVKYPHADFDRECF